MPKPLLEMRLLGMWHVHVLVSGVTICEILAVSLGIDDHYHLKQLLISGVVLVT